MTYAADEYRRRAAEELEPRINELLEAGLREMREKAEANRRAAMTPELARRARQEWLRDFWLDEVMRQRSADIVRGVVA